LQGAILLVYLGNQSDGAKNWLEGAPNKLYWIRKPIEFWIFTQPRKLKKIFFKKPNSERKGKQK